MHFTKWSIEECVVIFLSNNILDTNSTGKSCCDVFLLTSFSPHFFYRDNYPYFMMSTHFSFSFILYFVLCWYLLCKLFIIVPPLVHLSQPNHNQHHTTYVCRECIIRVLPPFPGGIQLLTDYMIAKRNKSKKNMLGMEYKKMVSAGTAI